MNTQHRQIQGDYRQISGGGMGSDYLMDTGHTSGVMKKFWN